MKKCQECTYVNIDEAIYCAECGKYITVPTLKDNFVSKKFNFYSNNFSIYVIHTLSAFVPFLMGVLIIENLSSSNFFDIIFIIVIPLISLIISFKIASVKRDSHIFFEFIVFIIPLFLGVIATLFTILMLEKFHIESHILGFTMLTISFYLGSFMSDFLH